MDRATAGRPEPRLDAADDIARIGVILFDEDITLEDDIARLRGSRTDVSVLVARMPLPLEHSPSGRDRALVDIGRAAGSLAPSTPLNVICYGCATGTLEFGLDALREAVGRVRPGVPIATPITGAVAALKAAGASRISLLTPYPDDLNRLIIEYLAARGIETVHLAVLDVERELDFARISPSHLRIAAVEAMRGDADALLITCTALKATALIPELEATLGRPVLTGAQSMWWEALGLAGLPRSVSSRHTRP